MIRLLKMCSLPVRCSDGNLEQRFEAAGVGGAYAHCLREGWRDIVNGDGAVGFEWAQPFPADMLPDCISRCTDYSGGEYNPTCRNYDIPYKEGNFTIIVDGFLVSDNVEAVSVSNIYTGFAYSDHGPVVLQFRLK